jgi:hypothetical protein
MSRLFVTSFLFVAACTSAPAEQGVMSADTDPTCGDFINCFNDAFASDPNVTFTQAEQSCAKSPGVVTAFNNALLCGQQHCLDNAACKLNDSQSELLDADGSMITDGSPCSTCLNDSLARLFGTTCTNESSPDCNPTTCATTVDACLN